MHQTEHGEWVPVFVHMAVFYFSLPGRVAAKGTEGGCRHLERLLEVEPGLRIAHL